MEAVDGLVDDRDRGDDAGRLHLDPFTAGGAVDLGVAEGRNDHPEAADPLAPDPLLLLQPGEEAADRLAGRVLVGELGDDIEAHHRKRHRQSASSPETRFTASTNSLIMS